MCGSNVVEMPSPLDSDSSILGFIAATVEAWLIGWSSQVMVSPS